MTKNLLFAVPLFGRVLKSAWQGDAAGKAFAFNMVMAQAITVCQLGNPAIVSPGKGR